MDKELYRRIRKAKLAQSKRMGSLGQKKKCKLGKSCGSTCIARHEVCAVEMDEGISQDLGKASMGIKGSRNVDGVTLSEKFREHIKECSFSIPGRSFTGEDIADMVNQAATGMTGEAKANMDRMRQFVVGAGQGLFISTYNQDPSLKKDKPLPWALSKDFVSKLDKYYDKAFLSSLPKRYDIDIKGAKSFSDIRNIVEKAIQVKVNTLRSDRKQELELRALVKRGEGTPKIEKLLKLLEDSRRDRDTVTEINDLRNYLSNLVLSISGVAGFTSPYMNSVVLIDSGNSKYEKGKIISGRELQGRISSIIEERAKSSKASGDTHLFSYKGNGGILINYIHEVGHQVHFKAGENSPVPPVNSVSLSRTMNPGISGYSNVGLPKNGSEAFAEAFVAYTLNPKALKDHDEPLYDWVRSTFEKALSS